MSIMSKPAMDILRQHATAYLSLQYSRLTLEGKGILVVELDTNFISRPYFVPADRISEVHMTPDRKKTILKLISEYDASSQMPVLLMDRQDGTTELDLMPCGVVAIPYIGYVD